uniref:pyruvate decarboxylase n=1 Tax=Oryza barthii TaxID=65489 RepID=A0A0D3FUR3_9ORYZ
METTGGGGSPKEAVVPSAASGDATLSRHLAWASATSSRVPGDLNLTLLDYLIAEPGLCVVGCCNGLNAGYLDDGYARARGVGACAVTFTIRGLLLHGGHRCRHRFWNQETGDEAGAAFRNQERAGTARSLPSTVARRSGSVSGSGGSPSPSSPPSPSSETTTSWDRHG